MALRVLSVAATAILGLFFGVMLMSYFRGASIDRGCFGVGEPLSAKTLLRDGVLLTAALALVFLTRRKRDSGLRATPNSNPESLIPNP